MRLAGGVTQFVVARGEWRGDLDGVPAGRVLVVAMRPFDRAGRNDGDVVAGVVGPLPGHRKAAARDRLSRRGDRRAVRSDREFRAAERRITLAGEVTNFVVARLVRCSQFERRALAGVRIWAVLPVSRAGLHDRDEIARVVRPFPGDVELRARSDARRSRDGGGDTADRDRSRRDDLVVLSEKISQLVLSRLVRRDESSRVADPRIGVRVVRPACRIGVADTDVVARIVRARPAHLELCPRGNLRRTFQRGCNALHAERAARKRRVRGGSAEEPNLEVARRRRHRQLQRSRFGVLVVAIFTLGASLRHDRHEVARVVAAVDADRDFAPHRATRGAVDGRFSDGGGRGKTAGEDETWRHGTHDLHSCLKRPARPRATPDDRA